MNGRSTMILESIGTALSLYENLEVSVQEYIAIKNSSLMLRELKEKFQGELISWEDLDFDYLDVGLLAVKALDLYDKENVKSYSRQLCNVSILVQQFYGQIRAITGARLIAYKFYRKHGFNDVEAKKRLHCIDFSRNVNVRIYNKNYSIYQWHYPGRRGVGDWSSPIQGINPTFLGIHQFGEDLKGNQGLKVEHKFNLQSDIEFLESIAASIVDTWSISRKKSTGFLTAGGAVQLFNRVNKRMMKFDKHMP